MVSLAPLRRLRVSIVLLLAACARERRPYGNEIAERAELREAWTSTFVWFAVVFVLVLALVVVRHRRKPIPMLGGLFRARRMPDVAEWRRQRVEAAAARKAQRAALHVGEQQTRAAQPLPRAPEPAPVPLGPPTLGLGRRFAYCLLPSLAAAVLFSFNIAGASMAGWAFLGVLFFGGAALLVAVVASLLCALLVSVMPWHNVPIASAAGAVSAALGVMIVPWLGESMAEFVIAGALIGVFLGIADEASRKPLAIVQGDGDGPGALPAAPGASPSPG